MRHQLKVKLRIAAGVALLVPVIALAVIALAETTRDSSRLTTDAAQPASAEKITVIVLGGSLSDPYWTAVHRGVKDAGAAAKAHGGVVDYLGPRNYDNFGPDMARLNQTALARNPSAVVSPNWLPGDQTPGLKRIVKAGIPLFEYDTGLQTWRGDGALRFIGQDETLAGMTAGQAFVKAGVKNVICVNTVPGAQSLEARCDGVKRALKAGGGSSKTLELPSTTFGNPLAVTQAIKGVLISSPKVDGVITISANNTDDAAKAVREAGRTGEVTLGTFDISVSNLVRIIKGQQLFAIDAQPYLMGYYVVSMAFHYAKWGLLPSGSFFKTGPILITKATAAQVLAGAEAGIRGAS